MKIVIGGAWPYANGALHIGHLASLLPGDVLARYHRLKGDDVYYVSGSDCHGTPVTIRAKQEGKTPQEISDTYHASFCRDFEQLGFSYDIYTKTSDPAHIEFVRGFHQAIYEGQYAYEAEARQAVCPSCQKTLTDRMVHGRCPSCGEPARGEQCDACNTVLEAEQLLDAVCADCRSPVSFQSSRQIFLALTKLEAELRNCLAAHPDWRKTAHTITATYLEQGLRDRAITRDLDWGILVPKDGYDEKRIYIWAENVLGYLSAAKTAADARGVPFEEVWGEKAKHYYVHGKDNVPFHSIILPALLYANGQYIHEPDLLVSSAHVTLEGRKISTSGNWAVWAEELARYNPDAVRYFFLINGPENRDADFSWQEFYIRNNAELLGAYGNFVNRTLAFIEKYSGGVVPEGTLDAEWEDRIRRVYQSAGDLIESGEFKHALEELFRLVHDGNRYYDAEQPWKTRTEHPEACAQTLYTCVQLIANLANLLLPFLPFSSQKIADWLSFVPTWRFIQVPAGTPCREITILFERIS